MNSAPQGINPAVPPTGDGCVECESSNGWWLHLRRCAECGHIGCCDDSPAKHATAHANTTGHRMIASYEPGEDWFFDYDTSKMYSSGPDLTPPLSHPDDQPVPGPAGKVPANWTEMVG